MNLAEQPQEAYKVQPNSTQTKQSMYKLQLSVINYLFTYLAHQRRMESLDSSRFSSLNWRNPRQQELEAVSFIKSEMKDVLQQQSFHGRETSQMELILDVLRQLWAYFRLNQRNEAQSATPTSQHYDQEWRDSSSSDRSITEDFDALANNLQQQTESLQQNETCNEDSSNFQNLRRILDYLEKRTSTRTRSRNAQTTSYNEEKVLEELDWIMR